MIERSQWQRALPAVAGFAVFSLVAAAFFGFWTADRQHASHAAEEATRITAEQAARRVEEFVGTRLRLGALLRTMWEDGHVRERGEFEEKAAAIHQNFDEIVAINWIDPDGVIRWVTPHEPNRDAEDRDVTRHPVAAPLLEQARVTGRLVSSPPLDLYQGGRGFTTYLPIDTPEGHAGWINVVFGLEALIDGSLVEGLADRYFVALRDDDRGVFFDSAGARKPTEASHSRPVSVGSRTWELTLSPRTATVDAAHGKRDDLILLFGLVLGVVAGSLTWLRMRGQSLLKASEARYRGVVEELPDLICRFKPDTTITFVNDGYAAYFGRDRESLIGTSFLELIPESDHEAVRAHLAAIDAGNPVRTVEHEVFGLDGEIRWQRWRDRALFGPSGQITEFQSIGVDITAEKHAEHALRRSESRYKTLLESVSEGIAIHDEGGRIVEVNDHFCRMTGRDALTLIGGHVGCVSDGEPPYTPDRIAHALHDVRETGESKVLEWRAREAGGRPFWAEIRLMRVETGGDVQIVAAVRDISERKRLEEQLRQSQKLQAVGTLSAGVAHDFNNVITAVLGFSETASLLVDDRPDAVTAMRGIRQACEQAAGVTRSLLTFSRGGGGEKSPLLIEQVLKDTAGMLHHMMPASVSLRVGAGSTETMWVAADESQVQQVVVNLAINARDAMPDGGTIELTCRHVSPDARPGHDRGHGFVAVTMSDTGTGMSEEICSRAIEPFFTTKPREQGTGLGLAVVHGIVTDHGGSLEIASEEGVGTRVTITLPCCASPLAVSVSSEEGPPAEGRGETVLVIEDNTQVRALIARALERGGLRVLAASDGLEGVACFRANRGAIRAAVIDVDLPGLGGPGCVEAIRSDEPGLPVLMISGLPDAARAVRRPEGVGFMQKPFRIEDLRRRIGEMLARSSALTD